MQHDPGKLGMEDYYYLGEDFFNVIGLAEGTGASETKLREKAA